MNKQKDIIVLEPVLTNKIWGGTKLKEEYGYQAEGNHIGECWGIAAHPNGDCVIKSKNMEGMKLSQIWKEYPELFGRSKRTEEIFPLLIKIIDAKQDLSIQVHPDDDYAKRWENGSLGKTECWYILDCQKDASIIIGHHAKTKEELSKLIQNGKWKELLQEIPVHKGDFIQINPGTIHAIKGGIMLLETQQNSDVTYRLYDYDRISNGKPRQLHIKKSIDTITVPTEPLGSLVKKTRGFVKNKLNKLYRCQYYDVFCLEVIGFCTVEQRYPFLLVSVVEGGGFINSIGVKKGNHLILPYNYGEINFEGEMKIIASTSYDDTTANVFWE
ncbi:mannose-6-phosphate isomerase, class I [Anaerosacchariphilus polymeriproducens]|uniref:mannose-6-phosphate isomerase n=1 Tax=Anaerosacchariphilus polymeriproducens TaxID=1812858 RepID=A0A371AW77_9FIRM|nr:mannose-6-phosphate isomerase, class I [Anaerosacchariphilus polymeriproducens]RDU23835.1 mannose-6-phosphate isomerase, class I [Anaerosacchariphilus polymeriproducens]